MANRYPFQPSQGMKRQHLSPHSQQTLSQEQVQKQRDYLKQQQKLRLMAAASHKGNAISTETLIENLFGSKEILQPVDTSMSFGMFRPSESQAHPVQLPVWLSPKSPLFPPQYHQVWSLVGLPDGMVDTAKVYPLLLTSGLHTDVLGFIWGLSNRQVPGTLTEQELYVLLALVALAQSGYSFNNANVLNLIPQPLVPNLNLGSDKQECNEKQECSTSAVPVANVQHSDLIDADDFTDFQSAAIPNSSQTQIPATESDVPKNTFTSSPPPYSVKPQGTKHVPIQKFPTVAVVGGGRSIGSRLANHSLSTPKLTKGRHHKHHHHHNRSMPSESASVSIDEEFSDFQQALPLPSPPPPQSTHTYLLKESAIRTQSLTPVTEDTGVLMGVKEDKSSALGAIRTQSSTPVTEDTGVLMGVEEDKYSALRALSACDEDLFSVSNDGGGGGVVDEVVPPWESMEPVGPQASKFQLDDWSLFMSAGDSSVKTSNTDHQQPAESNVDVLSNQILDLNLSTPLQTEALYSSGQNIMSLFNQSILPVTSQTNVDGCSTSQEIDDGDDFGDFVSPVSIAENERLGSLWSEEVKEPSFNKLWLDESKENQFESGKYDQMKLSKDGMLDNPLVSSLWTEEGKAMDSQSVRSLELPGLEQAWDSVGEWKRCVQSCVSVLQFAVDTLESISEPKILQEVLTSLEGQEYLKGLVEVWAVCERLAVSYRQSGTDHKLDALLNSAETMWISLKQYYQLAQVTPESEETVDGRELCGICLVGGAKLEFGGRTYHPTCGNLWLNLVDTTGLPALHPSCT